MEEDYFKPGPPPDNGLPLSDLVAIAKVIEAATGISDKRFLSLRVDVSGNVIVILGQYIGGFRVALQKQADGWTIVATGRWFS